MLRNPWLETNAVSEISVTAMGLLLRLYKLSGFISRPAAFIKKLATTGIITMIITKRRRTKIIPILSVMNFLSFYTNNFP